MNNKALVRVLTEQGIPAEYITDQMFFIGKLRVVDCNSFDLSARCTEPRDILRALRHDGLLNITDTCLNEIIRNYNLLIKSKSVLHEQGSN